MLENGARVEDIQQLLGHKTAHSTEIYTRVSKEGLQDVYDRTHPQGNRSKEKL
jgi:integrase/recombinase XerD